MKKNLLFLLSLASLVLYATPTQAHNNTNMQCTNECTVSTYDPIYQFELEFNALFLKPGSSNLHFAAEAIPLPVYTPHWNIFDLQPHYRFGFDLGLKVVNHAHRNCFMINWEHFQSCTAAAIDVGIKNMVGPFSEIGPNATPYKLSAGQVHFSFNEVNIDMGHFVQWGDRLHTNMFGGIGITSIKECLRAFYSNTNGDTTRTILTPSTFLGAGPQLGIDFTYDLTHHFYIHGKGIGSLLTGPSKSHTEYLSTTPVLATLGKSSPNEQSTSECKRTLVVPAFQDKIGLGLAWDYDDYYFMQIEAGYQAQIYLSALQATDMGSQVPDPDSQDASTGVYARTFQRNISNFSLSGPYITADLRF